MAEGVLSDLARKVHEVLDSLILQEINLASGVKAELENLKSTVSTIQAVLPDAEKQSSHDQQIKGWLRELRDVFLDADDLLDDFSTVALQYKMMTGNKMTKEVSIFFSSLKQLAFSHKMGQRTKAVGESLNVVVDDRKKFNFKESPNDPQVMNRDMETYSFQLKDVVRREDDKKNILKLLMDTNIIENVSIIPIVGIGGLGKTKLAQLIYNDENVKIQFELRFWICVPDSFDVKKTVKKILESLGIGRDEEKENLDNLQNHLRKKLNGKKYFIVLDDVRNEDQDKWLHLKFSLMGGAKGSRIVITTRSENVAKLTATTSWYPLKVLPRENAWTLFKEMAFERGQEPKNQALVAIGKEIVEKCDGLPLAIRTIGSLLYLKSSENEWQSLDNELSKILKENKISLTREKAWTLFVEMAFERGQEPKNEALVAIGKKIVEKCDWLPLDIRTIGSLLYLKTSEIEWQSFLDNELSKILQQENKIPLTLKLGYDYLPSHLKQCFAYCKLFPKDHRIHVNTLIKLWAAQGFIATVGPRQRFEDVGREYFMELFWRSFFQDVEKDDLGNIESCKVHDLMHDLASLESRTESAILNSGGENVIEKVRHVSLDLADSSRQFSIPMPNGRKIRTILVSSVGGKLGKFSCDALISNFNHLRSLDLSELGLSVLPSSIGDLKYLRYLDLSKNYGIEHFPNSITSLLHLQTLKLDYCESLKELPQDIKKLVNLRHLDITGCWTLTHMPLELGNLTSLEILSWFVVRKKGFKARSSGGLSELKELNNLGGSIRIADLGHDDDMLECEAANMREKQHLQQLIVQWNSRWAGETECYDKTSLEMLQPHPNLKTLELYYYMGEEIPNWFSSLTNLVHLKFSKNRRLCHLPPLNQLPSLKSVDFSTMGALEYISAVGYSSSNTAEFFPKLSSLRICYCPNLKGWWRKDDDIHKDKAELPAFPCLLRLEIRGCPNLTSMPLFPHLKENLILDKSISKVLHQTMNMAAISSTSSSSCFKPLSQLESLELIQVDDLESLPEEWLQNLISLQELFIYKCNGLRSLPCRGIQHLTSLQSMEIWDCNEFALLNKEDDGMQWQALSSLYSLDFEGIPKLLFMPDGLQHVTTLQQLRIWECSSLNVLPEWITSLQRLEIGKCPNLTSIPQAQAQAKPPLRIGDLTSSKLPTMNLLGWTTNLPLNHIEYLELERVNDLEYLPEEWLRLLISLRELSIKRCDELRFLPSRGIQHLISLQSMSISYCDKLVLLNSEDDGMQWQALRSLISLDFTGIPKLLSLPDGLQHVTTLQRLQIWYCPNLKALPVWIGNLTSLQRLSIRYCPNLTSLPQGIRDLTSLRFLEITDCPLLWQRCKRQTGEDWPYIAHVPILHVD